MMVVSQTKVPPVSFYITLLADMLCGSHTSLGFWSEVRAILIHPNQCLASLVKSFDCEMGVMLQSHCYTQSESVTCLSGQALPTMAWAASCHADQRGVFLLLHKFVWLVCCDK